MKIVAASKIQASAVDKERNCLTGLYGKPDWGWVYTEFDSPFSLIADLQAKAQAPLGTLEIVSLGTPFAFDKLAVNNIHEFGQALMGLNVLAPGSEVFLSGCNTGLDQVDDKQEPLPSIAHHLSEAVNCTVNGARGYLTGSHAASNEMVTKSGDGEFPGAVDAQGTDCWNRYFQGDPVQRIIAPSTLHFTIANARMSLHIRDAQSAHMESILKKTMKRRSRKAGPYRTAPDATIWMGDPRTGKRLELVGKGQYLRDPERGVVWPFKDMPALERLMRKHVHLDLHRP